MDSIATDVAVDVDARALWWAGPLTYGGLAFFTVILVSAGVLVFAGCVKWSARSIPLFRWIAGGALALSLLPDAWLPGNAPGATWPIALALMATHVAAWLPTVFVLTNRGLIGK